MSRSASAAGSRAWRSPHLLGLTITPQAATRRPITETDLFSFVWIADPQMAPDGSRVAFLRVAVNRQKEQYETSIWIAGTGAGAQRRSRSPPVRETAARDGHPTERAWRSFAPPKQRAACSRRRSSHGMSGGEPRAVTDIPRGAGAPAWAPDGKAIAFSSARPDELPGADKATAKPRAAMGRSARATFA